jgi:hypothetical protein
VLFRAAAFRGGAFRVAAFRAGAFLRATALRDALGREADVFARRVEARGRAVFRARRGAAARRGCFLEEFLRRVARAALRLAIA